MATGVTPPWTPPDFSVQTAREGSLAFRDALILAISPHGRPVETSSKSAAANRASMLRESGRQHASVSGFERELRAACTNGSGNCPMNWLNVVIMTTSERGVHERV